MKKTRGRKSRVRVPLIKKNNKEAVLPEHGDVGAPHHDVLLS
jgi:hypothetical protein